MVEVNERVLAEAVHRGDSLVVDELVRLIEQYHPHEQPGVTKETLKAYVRALEDTEQGQRFDADEVVDVVDERLTDADAEYNTDAFYRLDGDRVSAYPLHWHDELGGETDLREHVRFLVQLDPEGESGANLGGVGRGVPEQVLLNAASIVGRTDPDTVKSRLEDLRDRGELVEDADQHPNARVRLSENTDNFRDSAIDS
jgi:hypothetical protein